MTDEDSCCKVLSAMLSDFHILSRRQQLDEPRYAEWLSSGSLSALDLTKQQHADQLRTAMRAAEPMLTAKHNIGLAALSATWTLQHLVRFAAEAMLHSHFAACCPPLPAMPELGLQAQRAAQQLLDIWVSHDKRDRVLVPDVDKNVFGSCYHVRETECQAAQQTLPHLAESIGTWRQRKLSASVSTSCTPVRTCECAAVSNSVSACSSQVGQVIHSPLQPCMVCDREMEVWCS